MKNKLSNLNDHLFAQLERLGEEKLEGEELEREINRTKAITSVSQQIIMNATLVLNAHKAAADGLIQRPQAEKLTGGTTDAW